jgi:hypothetical protein
MAALGRPKVVDEVRQSTPFNQPIRPKTQLDRGTRPPVDTHAISNGRPNAPQGLKQPMWPRPANNAG